MVNSRLRYIIHLDNIRSKKNISVKELCEGICSDRQYRKYLSGTNNISDQRIMEFCEKLKISARDFYFTLNEKDKLIFSQIKDCYDNLVNNQYNKAAKLLDDFSKMKNINKQNQRFIDYCNIRYSYESSQELAQYYIDQIKSKIDYPRCIENEVFDFVDIIFIMLLAKIEHKYKSTKALELLIKILNNPDFQYLSCENMIVVPSVYSNTAIILGKLKRFDDCIEVSQKGIEYCQRHFRNYSLTLLYYSLSMAYKAKGVLDKSKYYSTLCFANLIALDNKSKIRTFYNLLKKDFNADPFLFFEELKDYILE